MEPNQKIRKLIARALREKLSLDEWGKLNQWYQDQDQGGLVIHDHKGRSKSQVKREMFQNIEKAISEKQKPYPFYYFASLAAVLFLFTIWIFFASGKIPESTVPLYTVANGVGMKKKIKLPDGSNITLFHNSSIQFDPEFKNNRDVYLIGKAFFDVAPDTLRPFTVITPEFRTEVLGTSFVVDVEKKEVALKTGKVKIVHPRGDEYKLSPNQILTFREDKGYVDAIIDHAPYFGWAHDQLYFKDTAVPDLISALEDWYGVKIHSNADKNTTCHITGTYTNISLENLLEAIQYSIPITYEIHENNVSIIFKPCD